MSFKFIGGYRVSDSALAKLPTFNLNDYSPAMWLDATDASTLTAAGGAVSQWRDKTANGRNVSQAIAAKQPTTDGVINGLAALRFTAAGAQSMLGVVSGLASNAFIFMVLKPRAADAANTMPVGAFASGSGAYPLVGTRSSTTTGLASGAGTPSYRINGANASYANRGAAYTDVIANRVDKPFLLVMQAVDASAWTRLDLNNYPAADGSFNADLDIGEFAVFGSMPTGTRNTIETELIKKWGIV